MNTTNITLYREALLPHNPCADGLDWFDSMVRLQGRKKSLLIRGATSLLWLYSNPESKDYAVWAQYKGLLPPVFAHGADLRRLDLSWANIQGANLQRANLQCANLQRADLQWADLQWADLQWADLSGADLRGANLQWAYLWGANLQRANLQCANLRWAYLQWDDLQGANLHGAFRLEDDPPVPGWKLVGGRLQKAGG